MVFTSMQKLCNNLQVIQVTYCCKRKKKRYMLLWPFSLQVLHLPFSTTTQQKRPSPRKKYIPFHKKATTKRNRHKSLQIRISISRNSKQVILRQQRAKHEFELCVQAFAVPAEHYCLAGKLEEVYESSWLDLATASYKNFLHCRIIICFSKLLKSVVGTFGSVLETQDSVQPMPAIFA